MNRKERRRLAKTVPATGRPASPPTNPVDQLFAAAVRHHETGRLAEAEALYRRILAADAGHADALHLLGVLAYQVGRNDIAIDLIGQALAIDGTAARYHSNLGLVLDAAGRLDDALACYDAALRIEPGSPEAHANRGATLNSLGRHDEALAACDVALRIRPAYAEAHSNRGNALSALGRLDEAVAAYDAALRVRPDYAEAHSNRGAALKDLGRHAEAVAACDAALRLQPDHAAALSNRAVALKNLDRLDEALAACDAALRLAPDSADLHYNRGTVLHQQGRLDEALACWERALALRAEFVDAHWNRACTLLTLGRFEEGFRSYEWRWRRKEQPPRPFAQPQWRGEDITGRTLLLHAEQGLGDTLQFLRFVPQVAARGARVLLAVQRPLQRLAAAAFPGVPVIAEGDPLPDFDLHCPLLSLPLCLGTTLDTVPSAVPYLTVDPEAAARWHERLTGRDGLRVGLVWAGSPGHRNDHTRSMPFDRLAPLFELPGIDWISLQVGTRRADLTQASGGLIRDVADDLTDFTETAAAVTALDLVVTVDTAVAHLAGALARPVVLMIPFVPDWRWLLGRDDSPWYPTVHLVRQPRRGDWDSVVREVGAALARRRSPPHM